MRMTREQREREERSAREERQSKCRKLISGRAAPHQSEDELTFILNATPLQDIQKNFWAFLGTPLSQRCFMSLTHIRM